MLVLALDTATPAVIAGLVEIPDAGPPAVLAERLAVDARAHTELLVPLIEQCCAAARVRLRDIAAVIAGVGPGPFTGLRVGLATAAAIGDAARVPSYGVGTLDAIAAAMRPHDGDALVATDARRREVYWARYDPAGRRIAGPAVSRPAQLGLDAVTVLAGAGAGQYAEMLSGLRNVGPDYPEVAALARLAAERVRDRAPAERLVPLYLRRPDAVPGRPKSVTH